MSRRAERIQSRKRSSFSKTSGGNTTWIAMISWLSHAHWYRRLALISPNFLTSSCGIGFSHHTLMDMRATGSDDPRGGTEQSWHVHKLVNLKRQAIAVPEAEVTCPVPV